MHEIEVARTFDHPNVIRVVDSGHTAESGYPFYVMPYYPGGSLDDKKRRRLRDAKEVFEFFTGICEGVAHIHTHQIVHRDLKPANIFIDRENHPVVGDFGLCFRFDAESLTEPQEVAAARWFGAPDLRDGHCEQPPLASDVYSLGKLLYWLFSGKVYDGHEQDYEREDRKLASISDPFHPAYAFADDIVAQTVKYNSNERIPSAGDLATKAGKVVHRIEAGGHALDLRLPQLCTFCAAGRYRAAHDVIENRGLHNTPGFPTVERRRTPTDPSRIHQQDSYERLKRTAENITGAMSGHARGSPLYLVCDHCGNIQQFRLDLTEDGHGENWRP